MHKALMDNKVPHCCIHDSNDTAAGASMYIGADLKMKYLWNNKLFYVCKIHLTDGYFTNSLTWKLIETYA